MYYAGVDIGGSKILVSVQNANGTVRNSLRCETPQDLNEGLNRICKMLDDLSDRQTLFAIGAACGGPLDYRNGIVSPLHQKYWREVALKAMMQERFGCPFAVDVDTNVAALGEWHYGGARVSRLLYITLSTGMGGALLVDGKIYRGVGGAHPEIGHQSVGEIETTVRCSCGALNCLEALIAGRAIHERFGRPAEQLEEQHWSTLGQLLGRGLRNAAMLYAPELIVIGGGVALGAGAKLLSPAVAEMRANMRIVPAPEVRLSRLGAENAVVGALVLARSLNSGIA